MPLSKDERRAIMVAAIDATKAEFASEVAKRTVLTTTEVALLGKTQDERVALAAVIDEVTKATVSNQQKAEAIRGIQGGVEALVKVAALLV